MDQPVSLPTSIADVQQLEDLLSEPTAAVVDTLGRLDGDLLLLGVGGKMGPTLARMARRAFDLAGVRRRVIGVSRFSTVESEQKLQASGVETIRCDLLDDDAVARLPDAPYVIFMTGKKFGSSDQGALTWATNTYVPSIVCKKWRRSRIVAFSTGNVYDLVPVDGGGSRESDAPRPIGEYAMSCLGRERMFEHFSRTLGIPMALVRLNYACELRYGVLVDLAQKVWHGETIDLTMGYFNILWQGDANAVALRLLEAATVPPAIFNLTGPETLSVRATATRFGAFFGKEARLTGNEADTALLSNARATLARFGPPRVSAELLMRWIADWTMRGGVTLQKPTHFATRDGRF